MKIDETPHQSLYNGEYTIMVSSSVKGFESQLGQIYTYLSDLGLNVVMSKEGTLKLNPLKGSFRNCLEAAERCDLFLGIIRKNCGSGRTNECSITFEEFKQARKSGRPCWYIIDRDIDVARMLLMNVLELREHPKTYSRLFNKCVSIFYDLSIRLRKPLPKVMKLYKLDRSRYFDEECFAMEDFVNQKDNKDRINISNNYMQYIDCDDWYRIERFLDTNFKDKQLIDSIVTGV